MLVIYLLRHDFSDPAVQVIAYLEVEPDVMPAKIYVNETAQALRSFMEPFAETWHQPSSSNCSDLLNRVMVAGALVIQVLDLVLVAEKREICEQQIM